MEFPDLGQHCSDTSCKRLDFLPMKCDACYKIFCKEHIQYSIHNCPESYKKDNQVPVCPLCNTPIPVKKGELPDEVVGQHIDNDCQSDVAEKRRKIYTNRCNKKGCKQKELVPVTCDKCHKNFCLKHRHEVDHECKGFQDSDRGISKAGAAATKRLGPTGHASTGHTVPHKPARKTNNPQQTITSHFGRDLDRERREREAQRRGQGRNPVQSFQGTMSEDEAVAQAMAASMAESGPPPTATGSSQQEQQDLALAKALAESEREAVRQAQRQNSKKDSSCEVS